VLQVGVHEEPLVIVFEQSPLPPLVGLALSHELALQELAVNVPLLHLVDPEMVYPMLQVGVHVDPLSKVAVHVPNAPLVGAMTVQLVVASA